MIQHCLQCDRPMHLRGGDMTTTCAECLEKAQFVTQEFATWATEERKRIEREHPLPRSEPHDLDARALRARLEDRERVIALNQQELQEATSLIRNLEKRLKLVRRKRDAFRERCQKLEAVAEAARCFVPDPRVIQWERREERMRDALAALDAKEGG